MPFDVEAAKKSGYSDSEIAGYLASQQNFDADSARKSGYSDLEIIKHLSNSPAPPDKSEKSFGQKFVDEVIKPASRQIGLTARAGVRAAAGIPTILAQGAAGLINAAAGTNLNPAAALERNLTRIGLPEPANGAERFAGDVASAMGGAGLVARAAQLARPVSAAGKAIADIAGTNPGAQIAAAGTGGAAAASVAEMGGGPDAQIVAGLVGGIAPAGIGFAVPSLVRGAMRGGELGRQEFQSNVGLFENGIGITPSVGMATENPIMSGIESGLSRFPGGNVPIIGMAERVQTGFGKKIESMASDIAPLGTKMSVGSQIESGITGPGGYLDQFKARTKALYDALDTYIGKDHPIDVSNTKNFLDGLVNGQPGAKNLLATLQNAKVIDVRTALNKDLGGKPGTSITLLGADGQPLSTVTQGGVPAGTTIPFDAWKQVRSRIGELLGDSQLTSDIPRRQLKGLYASMSRDLENAARTQDNQMVQTGMIPPGATPVQNASRRANDVTREIHQRIDNVIQPIINAGGPENLYNAAVSGTKDGDSKLRTVMQMIPMDAKNALTADIIRRMGRATGSGQSAEGNTFSTERFLTQFSNMSPEAKNTIFGWRGSQFTKDLNQVIKISDELRQGSTAYKNPSGSGQAIVAAGAAGAVASGALMLPFVGPAPLISGAALIGSTYGGAKLLTSPSFVHWLAQSTRRPVEAIPAQLSMLNVIATRENDPDVKQAIRDYASEVKENYGRAP